MLEFAACACLVDAHLAALRKERADPVRAQFNRLLDCPVHLVGARQALTQMDGKRALGGGRKWCIEHQMERLAGAGKACRPALPRAVEGFDLRARLQSQYPGQVMALPRLEHDRLANRRIATGLGHHHQNPGLQG